MERPLRCLIASNSHGLYCVPASSKHRPAARAILAEKVWEAETLGFLCANCAKGDVIHAGTYFGDFLPALSKAAAPDARIWAFEPSRENFRCAEITLKLNGIQNVALKHAALGEALGTAQLCTSQSEGRPFGGGSAIAAEQRSGFIYEEVKVLAIDDAVPTDRSISVLQLDVEYYEQQALTGALGTIRRCRPLLVLETLPRDPGWFAENILALGYEEIARLDKNRAFGTKPRGP